MLKGKSIREHIADYLDEHPGALMREIQGAIIPRGISTKTGIESVVRNMVAADAILVDRTNYKAYRYTLKEEARSVYVVDASHFEVPAQLAGPAVPPLIWSMRHLLGQTI